MPGMHLSMIKGCEVTNSKLLTFMEEAAVDRNILNHTCASTEILRLWRKRFIPLVDSQPTLRAGHLVPS